MSWRAVATSSCLLLTLIACRSANKGSPSQSQLIEPPDIGGASPVPTFRPTASTAPSAKTKRPSGCAREWAQVEFLDCNPAPTQHAYPECYQYSLEPLEEEPSIRVCDPIRVRLNVAGWQAISDSFQARVEVSKDHPDEVEMIFDKLDGMSTVPPRTFPDKHGAHLGTLVFEKGHIAFLKRDPAMMVWKKEPLKASAP